MEYTDEQIAEMKEAATAGIRGQLKEQKEANAALKATLDDVQAQLKAIADDKAAAEAAAATAELTSKGKYEEALEAYKASSEATHESVVAEIKAQNAKLMSDLTELRVDGVIKAAAANAVDPEQAAILIKASYNITHGDDGNVTILNSDGGPVTDADGKVVDLAGVTKLYLDKYPNLVKADNSGGSGYTGGTKQVDTSIDGQIKQAIKDGNSLLVTDLKRRQANNAAKLTE